MHCLEILFLFVFVCNSNAVMLLHWAEEHKLISEMAEAKHLITGSAEGSSKQHASSTSSVESKITY